MSALLLLMGLAWGAVCADDTVDELERSMNDLLEAHTQVDELSFDSSSKLMDAAVICLADPPPPTTLARLHHVMALRSFVNGQTRATKRSLAALRLLDPRWKSPFPEGHPFTDLWNAATDPGPVESIGSIRPKLWIVDAVERDEVPTERAFLLQVRNEAGVIRLNRYLFDPQDVPDMGQNAETDVNATPWTASLRLLGLGRLHSQRQRVDGGGGIAEQQASGGGGGATVQARVTPTAVVGGEAELSILPGDDLIGGQGLGIEGQAVLLLGSGLAPVGRSVLAAAGRLGLITDASRAWPGSANAVQPASWQLVGPSIGAEAGLRGKNGDLYVTVDGALAKASVPWLLDARVAGTRLISESVGLRASVGTRSTTQPLLDGDAVAGRAGGTELRLLGGVDLVF